MGFKGIWVIQAINQSSSDSLSPQIGTAIDKGANLLLCQVAVCCD